MSRNKDHLLGELVNYNQNSIKSREWWEFFNEIYKNRIPETFEDRKLFERSIELIMLEFGLYICNIRLTELLYICIEAWVGVFVANEF